MEQVMELTAEETGRLIVQVVAGVLPGTPDPKYTRRYVITSEEWAKARQLCTTGELLAEVNGKAQGYAGLLMLQPDALNWVQTEWLWL